MIDLQKLEKAYIFINYMFPTSKQFKYDFVAKQTRKHGFVVSFTFYKRCRNSRTFENFIKKTQNRVLKSFKILPTDNEILTLDEYLLVLNKQTINST